jgi:hypothetical protein
LSSSRRPSLLARIRDGLVAVVKIRRRQPYAVSRRRHPWSERLAQGCCCLFERVNTQWTRTACKMAMTVAAAMVVYMVIGNYLHQSFNGKIRQLTVEKQEGEKQHFFIQAELTSLVKKNQARLGLAEGKPEQFIRMN